MVHDNFRELVMVNNVSLWLLMVAYSRPMAIFSGVQAAPGISFLLFVEPNDQTLSTIVVLVAVPSAKHQANIIVQ